MLDDMLKQIQSLVENVLANISELEQIIAYKKEVGESTATDENQLATNKVTVRKHVEALRKRGLPVDLKGIKL